MKRFIVLLSSLVLYYLSINAAIVPAQSVIQVAEGVDAIETAISSAADGDIIELTTSGGDYAQGEFTIGKSITVRAAEGLAEKPIITAESTSKAIFKIDDSSTLTLDGLEMTGGKYAVRCVSDDSTFTASVKVNDCYAHTFVERFLMIDAESAAASGMDSVIIRNSEFYNITKEAIVFYSGSSSNAGIPMTYAEVSNCTFNTIGREAIKSQTSEVDKILIDQCTFYNCGTSGKSMLYIKDSKELALTNCIFVENAYSSYLMTLDDTYTVNNVIFYETASTKLSNAEEENVADTSYIDPLFIDAANGDFTLQLSSPALTFGDQGQAVGDLRWVVEATGFTFSPKVLDLAASAGNGSVMFSSTADWTIEVESGATSWLSVDKASGVTTVEPQELTITATENASFDERSAKVYGLLSGVVQDSVVVTQDGQIALEIVAQDEMQFSGAGETKTVTINAGTAWTISDGGASWITFDSASGTSGDNQVIDIMAAANTGDYRTDTLILTAGSSIEEIIVTQLRAPLTPDWTLYDCSELPSAFAPAFEMQNTPALEEVINSDVLRFAVSKEGKDVYERQDFENDEDFDTYDGFTLMAKIKGLDSARVIEFELKGGEYREKLKIEGSRINADKGKTLSDNSQYMDFPEGTDLMNEFVVFRMAYQRGTTQVWINEVYVGAYKSTTTDSKGELFGFGDSSDSYSYGVDIDWLMWDITGAYGPNEGASLPASVQIPTRLDNNQTSKAVSLYPNPSNGSFVVANQEGADLDILTLDGRTIYSQSNISANEQVTIDAKSGIYLVKVGELVNKIAIK